MSRMAFVAADDKSTGRELWVTDGTKENTYMVKDMSAAAVAVGADGLIVEVHPDPENALSDGYQSMSLQQFDDMMQHCNRIANALGKQMGSLEPAATVLSST